MSSDYDDEDFLLNLDDEDLRVLAEVEDKCGVHVSRAESVAPNAPPVAVKPTRGANPPPLKRVKVGGHTPVQDAHMSDDDAPDILVNADGTYSLDSPAPSLVSLRAPSNAPSISSKPHIQKHAQPRLVSPAVGSSRPQAPNGSVSAARPLQRHNSNSSIHALDTPPSTQGARPLVRAGSLSQAIGRSLSQSGASASQYSSSQYPNRMGGGGATRSYNDPTSQKEIEALRIQLAQAESEREKLRASLEQSKENSFIKAGEAENLRRTMLKQAEQHAEEVARLRQEMIEEENAKLAAERHMKLEMDQLRTAMAFKQHERETSRRGFPNVNSTLRKRQAPGSTQTQGSVQASSKSIEMQHSPLSPRKKAQRAPMNPPPLPEKSFNNLTNSFARSTSPMKQPRGNSKKPTQSAFDHDQDLFAPVQTSTQHPPRDKGKAKAQDAWPEDNTSTPVQRLTFGSQHHWDPPRLATQAPFAIESDVFGSDVPPQTPIKVGEIPHHIDIMEPVDLADELRMILLTHVILFRPPEGQKAFSLQHLLAVSVPANLQKPFNAACTSVFNAFSVSAILGDGELPTWDQCVRRSSLGLVQMAQVLEEAELLSQLHILFNLLVVACAAIPTFAEHLLKAGAEGDHSHLASTLCNVVLKISKDRLDQEPAWYLAESTLALCETLGWQATDDSVTRFSVLTNRAGVLPAMLDPSRPSPWTIRASRLLSVLTSRPPLVRALLSFPEVDNVHDSTKIPLVELLSRHLSAYRKHDTNCHYRELYDNILIALSQLAVSDTQSLTSLVESLTLIPSLVSFVYNITSVIWSELELSENNVQNHNTCLAETLRLAIQLLHYLSFSSDPEPNIRERLHYAPRGPFNGLVHMFIVSFGRLSFGDPPEYLEKTCAATIQEIRGMSEALLGTIVDGPEVDGIYNVFHDVDEDEQEAWSEEKVEPSVADEEEALQMSIDGF